MPSRLGLRVYRAPYSCLGVTERSVKQRPGDVIVELEKRRARDNVRARAPPDGRARAGVVGPLVPWMVLSRSVRSLGTSLGCWVWIATMEIANASDLTTHSSLGM